jgi:hypothetical protein
VFWLGLLIGRSPSKVSGSAHSRAVRRGNADVRASKMDFQFFLLCFNSKRLSAEYCTRHPLINQQNKTRKNIYEELGMVKQPTWVAETGQGSRPARVI